MCVRECVCACILFARVCVVCECVHMCMCVCMCMFVCVHVTTNILSLLLESKEKVLLIIVASTETFDTVPSVNKWKITPRINTKVSSGTFHVPFLTAFHFIGNL